MGFIFSFVTTFVTSRIFSTTTTTIFSPVISFLSKSWENQLSLIVFSIKHEYKLQNVLYPFFLHKVIIIEYMQ